MKQISDNHVSAFNAKTHFSNLLSQVRQGKKFIITKHDQPVALLTPINGVSKLEVKDTILEIMNFSSGRLKSESIKELKEYGRK